MADQTDTPDDQTLTWACLNPGHDQVQWVGDVAMCTHLGCGLTSRITAEHDALVRAAERRRLAGGPLREAITAALDRADAVLGYPIDIPPSVLREEQVREILAVFTGGGS